MKNGAPWRLQILQNTAAKRLKAQIKAVGADPYSYKMWEKGVGFAAKLYSVPCGAANILKQEAIGSGADAIVSRNTANCKDESTDVVILGNRHGIHILAARLKRQPFGLAALGAALDAMLTEKAAKNLFIKGKDIFLDSTLVMGVLNVTPDSFSDGGRYNSADTILERAVQIIEEGGAFIDIGGVSTRPGHTVPTVEEELSRLIPALEIVCPLAKEHGVYVSLDSWRAEVVRECLPYGIDVINDQSQSADAELVKMAADNGCAYCIMHNPKDTDGEIVPSLAETAESVQNLGLGRESILLDPGFGFGKSVEGNYKVLSELPELASLGYPVLAGISRKSMIGAAVGKEPQERTAGTVAAETIAALNGAKIIRTHNVGACADAMKVLQLYINSN